MGHGKQRIKKVRSKRRTRKHIRERSKRSGEEETRVRHDRTRFIVLDQGQTN